jgi:hypothetical protein
MFIIAKIDEQQKSSTFYGATFLFKPLAYLHQSLRLR